MPAGAARLPNDARAARWLSDSPYDHDLLLNATRNRRSTNVLKRVLHPAVIVVAVVALSAAAWLVPGESPELRGFGERATVSWGGIGILALYYLVGIGVIVLGVFVGRLIRPVPVLDGGIGGATRRASFDTRVYYILTVLSLIGVAYVVISAGGPAAFLDAIIHTNANVLKEATGGAPGMATLRYASAVAAPIGLHRALTQRRNYATAALNVLLLLTTAMVASRLSLIMATLIFVFLVAYRPVTVKFKAVWLTAGIVVLGGALVFFNYVRNAGYYAENGVGDPFSAAFFQGITYVGSPFQVALGVADGVANNPALFDSPTFAPGMVFIPSIFRDDVAGAISGPARYHDLVDIHFTLTTNSAFADTLIDYGILGLIFSMGWLFVFAMAFGHFSRYNTLMIAAAGGALYGFAELWRLLLFPQGIAIFTAVVVVAAGLVAAASLRVSWFDRVARPLHRQSWV